VEVLETLRKLQNLYMAKINQLDHITDENLLDAIAYELIAINCMIKSERERIGVECGQI